MLTSPRKISPDDLYNFKFVHDPCISSDGNQILFIVTQVRDDNDYIDIVWISDGVKLRPIIDIGKRISALCWSPHNDQFAYVATSYSGKTIVSKLWIANSDGLEKRLVTSANDARITNLVWSADGQSILFLSDFDPEHSPMQNRSDVKVVTRRHYRADGGGYLHDRHRHIFSISLVRGLLEASPKRVTDGSFDVSTFDVSPDGMSVAFVSNLDERADFQTNLDIYKVSTDGGAVSRLTNNKGSISSISFSPDEKYISFIGDDHRHRFSTPSEVYLFEIVTGSCKSLSVSLDREACNTKFSDVSLDKPTAQVSWDKLSTEVYFIATDRLCCNIFAANISTSKVRPITKGEYVVSSFSISRTGAIAYCKMDTLHPPELFLIEPNKTEPEQLTNFNKEMLSILELSVPISFRFLASDGVEVEGLIMKPIQTGPKIPGTGDENQVPCIVEVHGGGGSEGFHFMHEYQCLAANGYAVLACNFRGTQGYGEDFMKGLSGHYREKDYSDIVDMVQYAIGNNWIDRNRIGITGGSYGGSLTTWAIGHNKLFSVAVVDRAPVNLFSNYGTNDDYLRTEVDVTQSLPWVRPDIYLSKSPITYVKDISTPVLIVHSENDYRVCIEQAEQLFAYLKRQDKEVVFVRFPDESHDLSRSGKPHHRVERLKFSLWWFTSHIDSGYKVEKPA